MRRFTFVILLLVGNAWAAETTLDRPDLQRIDKIPSALKNTIVNDQRDISDYLDQLTFDGSETFRFDSTRDSGNQQIYVFREWINGIRTDYVIEVYVDRVSREIQRFGGNIRRNKNLATQPKISSQHAIEAVLKYVRNNGPRMFDVPIIVNGSHQIQPLYRGAELWQGVGIELEKEPVEGVSYEWFYVSPEGKVEPWVSGSVISFVHHNM